MQCVSRQLISVSLAFSLFFFTDLVVIYQAKFQSQLGNKNLKNAISETIIISIKSMTIIAVLHVNLSSGLDKVIYYGTTQKS